MKKIVNRNYFYFLICFIIMSCSTHDKVVRDLIKLQSLSICIPSLNVVYNGKDTIIRNINKCKLKFVVYTDSTGCTSCGINKMYAWETLLRYAKTYNERLKFYFIFHPTDKNINNLRGSMMMNAIDYPILIDKNGDFEKMNPHLPKNKAMHTFLLDENNKVILVGNPLYNKEIEKLFYKKTQELLSK